MEACPFQDQEPQEHYIIFSTGVLTLEKVAKMLPIKADYCIESSHCWQHSHFSQPFDSVNTLLITHSSLDAIPEDQVTDPPSVFQPLVPPPVPMSKVATTSYNISFPTTLQPRDRFDHWRGYTNTVSNSSARFSSGTGSSCSSVCSVPESPGSLASPFHEAKASNPYDVSEYQPLNVIEGKYFLVD